MVFTQINLIELKNSKRFSSVSLSLERIGFGISLWNMITHRKRYVQRSQKIMIIRLDSRNFIALLIESNIEFLIFKLEGNSKVHGQAIHIHLHVRLGNILNYVLCCNLSVPKVNGNRINHNLA